MTNSTLSRNMPSRWASASGAKSISAFAQMESCASFGLSEEIASMPQTPKSPAKLSNWLGKLPLRSSLPVGLASLVARASRSHPSSNGAIRPATVARALHTYRHRPSHDAAILFSAAVDPLLRKALHNHLHDVDTAFLEL